MAERKTKIMVGDRWIEGYEVPVSESSEKWSEFILEDGTIIRAKVALVSAIRVEGEYDPVGNPVYQMNAAPVIGIVFSDEKLRKKVQ
jgi:hypothetical protein